MIASLCFLIFGAVFILLSIMGRASISDYRETDEENWLAADEVGGWVLSFPYIENPDGREKVAKYLSRTYFKLGSLYLFLGVILIFLPEFNMELIWFSVIVCAVLASFGLFLFPVL